MHSQASLINYVTKCVQDSQHSVTAVTFLNNSHLLASTGAVDGYSAFSANNICVLARRMPERRLCILPSDFKALTLDRLTFAIRCRIIKIWDIRRAYTTHLSSPQPVVSIPYPGTAARKRGRDAACSP